MKNIVRLTIAFICTLSFTIFPQTITEKLDDYLNNCYEQNELNGVALIAKNKTNLITKAFGYADFKSKKKLTTQSAFYIASLAKQFTCAAIVYIKSQKKIKYDDAITKYLTDLPDFMKNVSIRNLMTHTSGIPDYYSFIEPQPGMTNDDVYKIVKDLDSLEFQPGTKFNYSNTGYILLAKIIEKISRMSYKDFMENVLWVPNAIVNTVVFDKPNTSIYERAKGFNADSTLNDYSFYTYGAGGIFSTVEDLFVWNQLLYNSIPVSAKEMEAAYEPMILEDGSSTNYGFGWRITQSDKGKILTHSGGLNGFRTYFVRDLGNKNTIILLTNKSCGRLSEMSSTIQKILAGEEFEYLKPRTD